MILFNQVVYSLNENSNSFYNSISIIELYENKQIDQSTDSILKLSEGNSGLFNEKRKLYYMLRKYTLYKNYPDVSTYDFTF